MNGIKRLGRHPRVRASLGQLFAWYLKVLRRTNRFVTEPGDLYQQADPLMPVIAAMWHGQHFMIPLAKRESDKAAALVSRSSDGELNAAALEALSIRPIRGSGARGRNIRSKGGMVAMRDMIRALDNGEMVVMTADIPKIARICGAGIITLARLSGRPIVPVAVVTSRRITFKSWDKASIGLPFGKGAIVLGTSIHVPSDCDEAEQEKLRLAVEHELERVHSRAYELVGSFDPGAHLNANQQERVNAQQRERAL
jgi:lysophospholipid acyltransferase (LPLAT)-like uncharacterized protein